VKLRRRQWPGLLLVNAAFARLQRITLFRGREGCDWLVRPRSKRLTPVSFFPLLARAKTDHGFSLVALGLPR
jgi:hypothetical protein